MELVARGIATLERVWRPVEGLGARVRTMVDRLKPSNRRWLRRHAVEGRRFDEAHGVDTAGVIPIHALGVTSEHRRYGVDYIGIDPGEFSRCFSHLPIRHEEYAFVDLGSGKGRALLMASHFPFRRVIGVEFSPKLDRIARRNVAAYAHPEQRCRVFDLYCMDAAAYELPLEPLVIFLYNPFGREVMERVAERIAASCRVSPRPVFVLYANPFQLSVWEAAGFTTVDRAELFAILVPPSAAEASNQAGEALAATSAG
jgi:SAM-dependent methyltransferase